MRSETYAYRHHFKWWREVKLQEREWESELKAEARGRREESTPSIEPNGDAALVLATSPSEGRKL